MKYTVTISAWIPEWDYPVDTDFGAEYITLGGEWVSLPDIVQEADTEVWALRLAAISARLQHPKYAAWIATTPESKVVALLEGSSRSAEIKPKTEKEARHG